jgi:hypothetical protein
MSLGPSSRPKAPKSDDFTNMQRAVAKARHPPEMDERHGSCQHCGRVSVPTGSDAGTVGATSRTDSGVRVSAAAQAQASSSGVTTSTRKMKRSREAKDVALGLAGYRRNWNSLPYLPLQELRWRIPVLDPRSAV